MRSWADRGEMRKRRRNGRSGTRGRAFALASAIGEAFALDAGLDEVGAGAGIAKLFAGGFDADALADRFESESAGDAVVEGIEVVVLEFDHFSAVDADKVVVIWVIEEIGVVGRLSIAEVDFLDEVGFDKESEGAVNGGAGGAGAFAAKAVEEFIGSEVFIGGEDDF